MDVKADDFINKFKLQLWLQRREWEVKVNLVAFVCFCIFDKGLEGMFSLVQGGKKGLVKQVRGISYLPKKRKKEKKEVWGLLGM